MRFSMNIYVAHRGNKGFNIKKEVLNRIGENGAEDLYRAIDDEYYDDENAFEKLTAFVEKATMKDLAQCVTVDEDSLHVDIDETHEWGLAIGLAYIVDVEFNTDAILHKENAMTKRDIADKNDVSERYLYVLEWRYNKEHPEKDFCMIAKRSENEVDKDYVVCQTSSADGFMHQYYNALEEALKDAIFAPEDCLYEDISADEITAAIKAM